MTEKKKPKSKPKPKTPTKKDIWETLSVVNVNEYLQKKGDYDYIPWADAWKIMMEHYPDASFQNHYNEDGYPCFYDPQGRGMVRVSVTVCGFTHTEDYMITNWGNTVIKDPSPSEVNNCLKRALPKCMAYFGLASYLYNSEDMADPAPTEEVDAKKSKKVEVKVSPEREAMMKILINHNKFDASIGFANSVRNTYKVERFEDLTDEQLKQLTDNIKEKSNGQGNN